MNWQNPPVRIYTCPEWGAVKPSGPLSPCGKAQRIILHHTAGHHAEISNPANESLQESMGYARAIQRQHMQTNGWLDSGHNFLVCRNGIVLQGRWLTVSMIQAGKMIVSAHCPGQNEQIGIEHEHLGGEIMSEAQFEASAGLMAWIAERYKLSAPLPVEPHSKYFATVCPANLVHEIPHLIDRASEIMSL